MCKMNTGNIAEIKITGAGSNYVEYIKSPSFTLRHGSSQISWSVQFTCFTNGALSWGQESPEVTVRGSGEGQGCRSWEGPRRRKGDTTQRDLRLSVTWGKKGAFGVKTNQFYKKVKGAQCSGRWLSNKKSQEAGIKLLGF